MIANRGDRSRSSSTPTESAPPVATVSREESLNTLIRQLSPLFEGYEVVGPFSVNIRVNPSVWNALSREEQQQLMDDLAAKRIVEDIRATLHLRVRRTEVGTIAPDIGGGYRFRRSSAD
jgi:hypothetical protein